MALSNREKSQKSCVFQKNSLIQPLLKLEASLKESYRVSDPKSTLKKLIVKQREDFFLEEDRDNAT
jgi:hypothetical protein